MKYFLLSVEDTITGRRVFLKLSAFSRMDALHQASFIGKSTVIDEISKPVECDNMLVAQLVLSHKHELIETLANRYVQRP